MENSTPTKKKQLPAYLVLAIIALVAAVVLAVTNQVTKGPIQEHKMAALRESFGAVMPADDYVELTVPAGYDVSSLYEARQGGETIGYCVTAVSKGYNGDVAVTLGVGVDGLLTGCAVGDTSFAETPGFGARAKEDAFQDQFKGIDAVNGGSFEALSGATVTSTAVLTATNAALRCVDEVALQKTPAADPLVTFGAKAEADAPAPAAPLTGNVLTGSAKGYDDGEVSVNLTLDDAGAISALTVDANSQTPGLGQRCMEAEFTDRFIGKTIPVEGVDALAGATVTSNAVIEAVNGAAPAAAEGMTASKKGFVSDVTVTLTTDGAGAIATLSVDASGETEGLGQRCAEEAFTSQFIGKSAPLALGDGIDAVTGATITSTAVVDAVNELLSAPTSAPAEVIEPIAELDGATLGVKPDGAAVIMPADGFTGALDVNLTVENGGVTDGALSTAAPAAEAEAPAADGKTASKKGFASDVAVTVTTDEAGAIATLTIDASGETAGLGQKCAEDAFTSQFIGKTAPFTLGDGVEAVTGATVTSTAVVDALNELLPAVKVEATAADGKTASKKGFASDVAVTVTTDEAGAIATLTIDASGETAGLGQKCAEDAFTSQFIGKTAPFTLGDGVEAVTGATVTSTAVVDALNELLPAVKVEAPAADGKTASKKGFASDVAVTVTTDEAGAIATLTIDASGETAGLGQKCAEDAFTSQFIGKTAPFTLGDGVEAVTGATVTSTAVVDALNELLPAAEVEAPAAEAEATPAPATEAEAPVAQANVTATGVAPGKMSDVVVRVTTDAEGKISAIVINATGETKNVGTRVMTNGKFAKQFTGLTAPVALGEGVDALTGATVTSQAVVDAVNNALLLPAEEAPAAEPVEAEAPVAQANVTATGVAPGKMSDVVVKVTTDAEGKISAIVINAAGETKNVGTRVMTNGKFAKQFTGMTAPVALGEGVDALTGATVTSQAVVDAVNNAFLLPAEEAPAAEPVEAEAPVAQANVTATGVAPGKMSDVVVKVTTDAEGKISAIVINAAGETKNVGTRVMTNGKFAKQFTGLTAPVVLGEGVDALTGATVTSQAVVDAVNNALGQ